VPTLFRGEFTSFLHKGWRIPTQGDAVAAHFVAAKAKPLQVCNGFDASGSIRTGGVRDMFRAV